MVHRGGEAPWSQSAEAARLIMESFAQRTGLSSPEPQARYLWTDAFAVCNYLTLFRRTGNTRYRDLTVVLIDGVHHVLGRHREDDPRRGWISGLSEAEGERHPTAGGLRIGKPLNERGPQEPYDPRLEWDRDGQYYHYLTRWTHALSRAGRMLGHEGYYVWAAELAEAAHSAFVYTAWTGGPKHMRWKMSIDLTRPLVGSEGAHDALDGFVTAARLLRTWPDGTPRPGTLDTHVSELSDMCAGRMWVTDDPLGAGGLLMDACWVTELSRHGGTLGEAARSLVAGLWDDSLRSVRAISRVYRFERGHDERLAFRELGLAIGLLAVDALLESRGMWLDAAPRAAAEELRSHLPLASGIVSDWASPRSQEVASWTGHRDINEVMLATALVPDEYLDL